MGSMKLDKLIIVHKTHLDVGFTDLAANVERQYLEDFIPAALQRARSMNREGEPARFVWTTGSWIIWKALERLEPGMRAELEAGIARGWVAWHALPFTFHTELLSPALLRLALKFAQELDQRFGRKTIAAKMTDVPGHTIGLVPVLAEAGIEFLHIGVNPASRVPDVPPVFRWQCGERELTVAYSGTYGNVTVVPGLSTGLTFLHTNDNLGPPSKEDILANEEWLKARHAVADVHAGTLDAFAKLLRDHRESLPVVYQEIGDSWIHGVGSDPLKTADYCAMRRALDTVAEDLMDRPLDAISNWLEPLLLVPEHTWGLDVKAWFGDHANFSSSELTVLRRSRRVRKMEESWNEQRAYVERCLQAAPFLAEELESSRRVRTEPVLERPEAWSADRPLRAGRWLVRLEPATGLPSEIFDLEADASICSGAGRMGWGLLRYEHYGRQDYLRFLDSYMGTSPRPWWAEEDFRKIGLPQETRESATLRCDSVHVERGPGSTRILVLVGFLGDARLQAGAPQRIGVSWIFHHSKPRIELTIGWSHKPATRLAEALWLGFRIPFEQCRMKKLGQWIPPDEVVRSGGVLHAVEDEIRLNLRGGRILTLTSLDAPLFAPCAPELHSPVAVGDNGACLWFNLFNNLWNTNFRLWNGEAMGFRFRFDLGA